MSNATNVRSVYYSMLFNWHYLSLFLILTYVPANYMYGIPRFFLSVFRVSKWLQGSLHQMHITMVRAFFIDWCFELCVYVIQSQVISAESTNKRPPCVLLLTQDPPATLMKFPSRLMRSSAARPKWDCLLASVYQSVATCWQMHRLVWCRAVPPSALTIRGYGGDSRAGAIKTNKLGCV